MAEKFQIDSTDLLPNIRGRRNMGSPGWTDEGWQKHVDGERTTDADRTPRTISFTYVIEGATVNAMHSSLQTLKDLLSRANYVLTANDGGSTETDRYYDCLGLLSLEVELVEGMPTASWLEWPVLVEIEAKPFARKAAIELPRNWVVNPGMNEDFSGDGVAEGFTYDETAMGAVGYATPSIDSGQKIVVSDSDALNEAVTLSQVIADADGGETWSFGIEYKMTAMTNCAVAIYAIETDGDANSFFLLSTRTTVQNGWTKAQILNQTLSAGTTAVTFMAIITTSDANASGTLWVRKAIAIQDDAFPVGDDGVRMFWGSEVTTSPATLPLENIPGDVDAQVFMQVIAGELSSSTGTADQLVVGGGLTGAHVISFGGEADANALGGVCSVAETTAGEHIVALDPALRGRFLVAGRLQVLTSGTPADNTFKLNVYPNANGRGTPYSTTTIAPCAALGKWQGAFFFGEIELPMGGRPEWDWTTAEPQNSLGLECVNLASASWKRDFLALIPMRQGHGRIAGEILAATATKAALFDTIGDPPGAYFEYGADTTTVIAVTASGGSHNWFWGSLPDFTANIRSVYMPECDNYTSVTPSCGGCTFESYDSASKVARFATGANTTWNATIVVPPPDWWDYENLNTASNLTEPPDFDPIFIPAGDSVLVPMVAEYVNDANQNFKNVGAKVALRVVPRYL
jgi:hypothetical protein